MPFQSMPGGFVEGGDRISDSSANSDGALASAGYHALGSAVPSAVGLAAGIPAGEAITAGTLPFLGPFAPVAGAIGGFGVGAAAAYGASRAQDAALQANPRVAKALHQDEDTRAQEERDHPTASFLGDVAPNLAAFRPSSLNPLKGFGYLQSTAGMTPEAIASMRSMQVAGLVNAGVSGATDLGQQMMGDQPVDLTRVAMATGVGALGMKETMLGRGIAGIGRRAIPAGLQDRLDAYHGVTPNDGSGDQGAFGGAGAESDTSTSNVPALGYDGAPSAPKQLGFDGGAIPMGYDRPENDLTGTIQDQRNLPLPGGVLPAPDAQPPAAQALPPSAPDPATPIRGDQGPSTGPPVPYNPMQERPPQPLNPTPPPDARGVTQQDFLSDPVNRVALDFSPVQILRRLRDAAGTAEKPATPDSYMLQLSNAISKHISVDDPDGHAIHAYLADQLQILDAQSEQLKDHVINNQITKTNTPEQVKAQEQRSKDLDQARSQTEKQIKTLAAAQDAMPDIISHLQERTGNANREASAQAAFGKRQAVQPDVQAALQLAQERIAKGDTGGAQIGQPEPPAAGTVDQMTARNAADAAQAAAAEAQAHAEATRAATAHSDAVVQSAQEQHSAKVRDSILQSVLDDPTTVNPVSRFRVELRKAGVRDLSMTEAESHKVSRFEDARAAFKPEPDEIPSSPNEMDPDLVPEAKSRQLPKQSRQLPAARVEEPVNKLPEPTPAPADKPTATPIVSRNKTDDELVGHARAELAKNNFQTHATDQGDVRMVVAHDDQINGIRNAKANGSVIAFDKDGKMVGRLDYLHIQRKDGTRYNPDVHVDPAWQRKGVASAMYDLAEKHGAKIPHLSEPEQMRTTAGQAFREGRATKQPATGRPEVNNLRDLVNHAHDQGALTPIAHETLLRELSEPAPNLDLVRTTIAKGVKRMEAAQKARPVEKSPSPQTDQDKIAAFIAKRDAENPEIAKQNKALADAERAKREGRSKKAQDEEDRKAAAAALDEQYGLDAPLDRSADATTGMDKADVQSAVDEHTRGWSGGPKVEVHQDGSTLPEHLRANHSDSAGVYDPRTKTVHLLADNIKDTADAHATLFHEALGHFGLRKAFGDRLSKILDDVYRTNPRMRELADKWVAENGADHSNYTPAALARRGMDEAFAERSEGGPQAGSRGIKGIIERVKGLVRDFARTRLGMKLDYTDADVRRILQKAHESVTDGGPGDRMRPGTDAALNARSSKTTSSAIEQGQRNNTFQYKEGDPRGYDKGFPQEAGTPTNKLFSNFAEHIGGPMPFAHGMNSPEDIAARADRFRADMLNRTKNVYDFAPATKPLSSTHPFDGDIKAEVRAESQGLTKITRVILKDGDKLVGAARMEKGHIDSIAIDKAYSGKGYGEKLLRFLKDNKLANVESVADRSPGFVAIQKKVLSDGDAMNAPLNRKSRMGGTAAERVKNLSDPEVMKTTADDLWTNIKGSARRGLLGVQDLNWITESHGKGFVLNGEHLLDNWKDNLTAKDFAKASNVDKAKGAHDLYVALDPKSRGVVGDLLNDGSAAKVEVRTPRTAKGAAGKVEQDLRDRYAALTQPEKAAYDGMRQTYADQRARYKKILEARVDARDAPQAEKDLDKAQIADQLKDVPGYHPMMRFGDFTAVAESPDWGVAHDNLEALKSRVAKAGPDDKPALDAQLKDANKKFAAMQDEHRMVTSFEKESDMRNHAKEMRAQGWNVRMKLASDFSASIDGVAGGFMKGIMDDLTKRAEVNPEQAEGINGIKSMLNQQWLATMPANSAMKRNMARKGVAGFSTDAGRVYAASTQRAAGFLAEIEHGFHASDLLAKMRTVVDKDPEGRKAEVYNQLKKNFDLSKQYAADPVSNFLSKMSYAYYLGGSPSFGIMHTMQTPLVTLPMLAGHFGAKAVGALGRATADVMGDYRAKLWHTGQEHTVGKNTAEQNSIKYAVAHNLIASTETSQFMNAAMSDPNLLQKGGRAVMAISAAMPHHIERANRLLTNLAAFRLAMEDSAMKAGVHDPKSEHYVSDEVHQHFKDTHQDLAGMSKHEFAAARLAEKITADSHVDYSSTNSSYLLQKIAKMPIIGFAAQFQKYQFGMLKVLGQNMSRSIDSSLSGSERSIARRTLAGVLGSHAVMTGMMGLPGAGLALLATNIYHKFLGDHDTPFDAETSFRSGLANLLGKDAGDVASRGILYTPGIRNVLPADVTDRLGMGDLGNFTNQTRVSDKINSDTFLGYLGAQVTGPVGALLGNFANGYQFMHEGEYRRGIEEFAPKALRDLSKAQRFATAGVDTGTGMPVVGAEDLSHADIFAQLAGFTPQKVAEAYAQRSAVTEAKAQLTDRRSQLIKEYTQAAMAGDDTGDIRDQISEYNQAQREAGLRNQTLSMGTVLKAIQERRIAARRLQGGVSSGPRDRALRDQFGNYSAAAEETPTY